MKSKTTTQITSKTKSMTTIALITAITCIVAPFSIPIPISPVPISLTNLVLYISPYILGCKKSTISYIVYLLLGAVGLPIFSSFSGGLGKLIGPTGGYLLGFIFLVLITGLVVEHFPTNIFIIVMGMIVGTFICYIFGTYWLALQLEMTFVAALAVGVTPYLIGDSVKILIAIIVGPLLRKRLANIR
ncbi:MAG: biotin transporter BioY [Eubacteriales bacterium]